MTIEQAASRFPRAYATIMRRVAEWSADFGAVTPMAAGLSDGHLMIVCFTRFDPPVMAFSAPIDDDLGETRKAISSLTVMMTSAGGAA